MSSGKLFYIVVLWLEKRNYERKIYTDLKYKVEVIRRAVATNDETY